MKKLFLLLLISSCVTVGYSQKIFNDTIMVFNRKILKAKILTPAFKKIASNALQADDDCTIPPGCDIINPWTCECESGLEDPWGNNKAQPSRLAAFQSFEKAIAGGGGKKLLPRSLVPKAQSRYPGDTPKAMYYRLKMYIAAMR